jgi:hypothetical protein
LRANNANIELMYLLSYLQNQCHSPKGTGVRGSSTTEVISQSSGRLPRSVNLVLKVCEVAARSDIAEQLRIDYMAGLNKLVLAK